MPSNRWDNIPEGGQDVIDELEPVWKQFAETYDTLRQVLGEMTDEQLAWQPGPEARCAAAIAHHLARGNMSYCRQVGAEGTVPPREAPPPGRDELMDLLAQSEERVHTTYERLSTEDLRRVCADDWWPLGTPVEGPLDGLWFCNQMVRHSAYHLGQIVYITLLAPSG